MPHGATYNYNGITDTATGWARRLGLRVATLTQRLRLWSAERALSQPTRRSRVQNIVRTATHKECTRCRQLKLLDQFGDYSGGVDGLRSRCSECCNEEAHHRNYQIRYEVLFHYSNGAMKCALCPENRHVVLEIDHIDGGGNERRRTNFVAESPIGLKRRNYPSGYRVLCRNCNWIEGLRKTSRYTTQDIDRRGV